MMRRFLVIILIIGAVAVSVSAVEIPDDIQSGDILFQTFESPVTRALQIATESEYTHVGIVFEDSSGALVVWEAVQPVTVTPLADWIDRGRGDHVVVKRLAHADSLLKPLTVQKMWSIAKRHYGKDYDILFNWSDDKLYCSEYVWKIYDRGADIQLCDTRKLKDFKLDHPAVQAKLEQRYGDDIPYDETVVAPSDLYNCDKLITVYESPKPTSE